jgi:shikimate dehydrogenase
VSRRFLLLGHPVGHSLSPAMFAAAFREAGIDATYHALDVPPEALARELPRLLAEGAEGFNLTVPHKQAALPLLAALDPSAERVGAANTVALRDGVPTGFNTDVGGLLRALSAGGAPPLAGATALLLGAGGAARAAVAALARAGAAAVVAANRDPGRAAALAAWARRGFPALRLSLAPLPAGSAAPGALPAGAEGASLCLQATSLGLRPGDPLPLDPALLPPGCFLYDLVYAPGGTAMVRRARELGRAAADGRGMLLGQAAEAFSLWFGRPAPEGAMRAALERGLDLRDRGGE